MEQPTDYCSPEASSSTFQSSPLPCGEVDGSQRKLHKLMFWRSENDKRRRRRFLSVANDPDDEQYDPEARKIKANIWALVLSLLFPPLGCVAFCFSLNYPSNSPRYIWASRAMYVGAALSFIYSVLIAALIGSNKLGGGSEPILGYGF
eukprot:CAMPEP_0113846562 /NCGR_PEP_ID=MMETSP0372-20130328/1377_1 /TAXON_ID=340204 /ORGANISM="Lankesteria abbotti" /LENGTH=147 /DNA_ID=CAMNT_0000815721 /DNA_START=29 /DNA_END=472 /DNA_ORIENTATION=- /assembly_acc=CAM_ASM_000359